MSTWVCNICMFDSPNSENECTMCEKGRNFEKNKELFHNVDIWKIIFLYNMVQSDIIRLTQVSQSLRNIILSVLMSSTQHYYIQCESQDEKDDILGLIYQMAWNRMIVYFLQDVDLWRTKNHLDWLGDPKICTIVEEMKWENVQDELVSFIDEQFLFTTDIPIGILENLKVSLIINHNCPDLLNTYMMRLTRLSMSSKKRGVITMVKNENERNILKSFGDQCYISIKPWKDCPIDREILGIVYNKATRCFNMSFKHINQ